VQLNTLQETVEYSDMDQILSTFYSDFQSSNNETAEDSLRPPKKLKIDSLAAIGTMNNGLSNSGEDLSLNSTRNKLGEVLSCGNKKVKLRLVL